MRIKFAMPEQYQNCQRFKFDYKSMFKSVFKQSLSKGLTFTLVCELYSTALYELNTYINSFLITII